jgi:hypothetical protein
MNANNVQGGTAAVIGPCTGTLCGWQFRASNGQWLDCEHERYISKGREGIETRKVYAGSCPDDLALLAADGSDC